MMRKTAVRRITNYDFGHPGMSTGFGGVFINTRDPSKLVDSGVQRTKLDNGVTVITHDRSGPAAALGFYADAGVKYDSVKARGATALLRVALYGGNMNNSAFQIDRAFRAIGTSYGHADLNKKLVGATTYGNRTAWRSAVEVLSEAFAAPRFAESDIQKWRDALDNNREEVRYNDPREYAINELESVAYYLEPLGNPRLLDRAVNDKITSDVLVEKYVTYFNPNRVTVVGVNIAHQDLITEYVKQPFQQSAKAPHHERAAPAIADGNESKQYCGGRELIEFENRPGVMKTKPEYDQEAIVAVGWNTVGMESGLADYASALVYREMMSIKVDEALQNVYGQAPAHGTRAFYRPYSTAGLIGYTVRSAPEDVKEATKAALKAHPTDFVALLPAAKARAAVNFFAQNVETDVDYSNFLAVSPFDASSVLKAIDATSVSQLASLADSIKAVEPVLYATGDTAKLPSLRRLRA